MTQATIKREKHTIDATGKALGRLASEVAILLRGKNKPSWQPHIDAGDFVEIVNPDQVKFTGNKMTDKMYYRHSGFPGGLKEMTLKERIEKKGHGDVIAAAVFNMLPKNKLRKEMMKRLSFVSNN